MRRGREGAEHGLKSKERKPSFSLWKQEKMPGSAAQARGRGDRQVHTLELAQSIRPLVVRPIDGHIDVLQAASCANTKERPSLVRNTRREERGRKDKAKERDEREGPT